MFDDLLFVIVLLMFLVLLALVGFVFDILFDGY